MARSCTVCNRSDAGTIDEMLGSGRSARSVAVELGLSHAALLRHTRNHVGHPGPTNAAAPPPADGSLDPLDELVTALRVRALAGNPVDTREYRLALAAQAAARHAAAPHRSLADEPEWISVRAILLRVLAPYPEVRHAVADALAEAGA